MQTDRLAALIADLDHPDKPTIRAAVDALIGMAANAPQVHSLLDQRLSEPGHRNYWSVAYILGHLPKPSGATIGVLLEALNHREPDIRWACALLLENIARDEPAVIALLIGLCASGATNQKRMALYCLRDLVLSDQESLNATIGALSDGDATVRVAATTCLKFRADAGDLLHDALLSRYLNDADSRVRNTAAVTLAQLGSPSQEFVEALERAIGSDDRQASKTARLALEILRK